MHYARPSRCKLQALPCGCLINSFLLVLLLASIARADVGGGLVQRGQWSQAWNWDPVVLLNLGLLWWLYGLGLSRVWSKAGVGRGIGRAQPVAFLGGLLAVFGALVTPLDALSDELAAAHMVQHLLLTMVAAPLLVLGAPAQVLTWAVPADWRPLAGRCRRLLESGPSSTHLSWNPLLLWTLYALTLWIWHFPGLYERALRHPLVHDLQHVTFFGTAFLFWRLLLDPLSRRRLHPAAAVAYLFTTTLHASALGIFFVFSPRPWYQAYADTTDAWGLTPLEDQQLAGLVMWMPACLIYALVAAALLIRWLQPATEFEGPQISDLSARGQEWQSCT